VYHEWSCGIDGLVGWTRASIGEDRVTRILPDGCIDLIWTDGRLLIAGPDTTARQVDTPAGVSYVGVRFAPGHAPTLLGVPASELRDAQPELDDVWPGRGRLLAEQISAATNREKALTTVLREELRRAGWRPDPFAWELANRLRRGEPVEQIARAMEVSPRHLHRRSLAAFGYGPKTLARVLRLGRAISLARRGMALADVASTVGYADQAHFTRDARALSGVTPSELLRS